MTRIMNPTELSKFMSLLLRHEPEKYGLILDADGWADCGRFLDIIRNQPDFEDINFDDIHRAIERSDKKRHEIVDGKIRAVYGHSLERKIERIPAEPPEMLYHGTARHFLDSILLKGLVPKKRQYVHLSQDQATAFQVGLRRDRQPLVLVINAQSAWQSGLKFYQADGQIWLADSVPAEFIDHSK